MASLMAEETASMSLLRLPLTDNSISSLISVIGECIVDDLLRKDITVRG